MIIEPSMSQDAEHLKHEIVDAISQNWLLRILLVGGYRLAVRAAAIAVGYWILGIIIANENNALIPYLASPYPYLQTLSLILGVITAVWYIQTLVDVLTDIPKAFDVKFQDVQVLIKKWLSQIQPIKLITIGAIIGIVAVKGSLLREQYEWNLLGQSPPWSSMTVHFQVLVALSGILLGGGIFTWLITLGLLKEVFQFKLHLFRYRHLYSLSGFSTGMTVATLLFVAVLILLIFLQQDNPFALVVCGIGIAFSGVVFLIPQLSYQSAVISAKREYLNRLGILYEQNYKVIYRRSPDSELLQNTQVKIEALNALQKSIISIPEWLVEVSDAIRVLLSVLVPVGSTLVNFFVARLP